MENLQEIKAKAKRIGDRIIQVLGFTFAGLIVFLGAAFYFSEPQDMRTAKPENQQEQAAKPAQTLEEYSGKSEKEIAEIEDTCEVYAAALMASFDIRKNGGTKEQASALLIRSAIKNDSTAEVFATIRHALDAAFAGTLFGEYQQKTNLDEYEKEIWETCRAGKLLDL